MTMHERQSVDERVLVLALHEGDAAYTVSALREAGLGAELCGDMEELCREIEEARAGAAVVTVEAISPSGLERLLGALRAQPAWSDVPLVVLTSEGAADAGVWQMLGGLEPVGNLTLLERPMRTATLISAVRVALRARRRQREIKEHVEERERAAKALRQSQELYRMVGEAAPDFLWSTDAAGRLDYVNRRWLEYTGMTVEEFNKDSGWERVHHPEDLDTLREWWAGANNGGELRDVEFRYRRHDGEYRWFTARMAPVRDGEGRVIRWVGTATDIDDRRQAELALRESEERFRTMADAAPVMIWLLDPRMQGVYFSRSWLEFSGRSLAMETGEGWTELIHPEDFTEHMSELAAAFLERRPFSAEYRMRRADGEFRWVINQVVPRFSPAGSFLGYIGSCTDITERKRAESRLAAEHAVTRILAEADSLEEAAPALIRAVCEAISPRLGELWLAEEGTERLRCVTIRPCAEAEELQGFIEATRRFEAGRGIGLPGRAWTLRTPIWIADLDEVEGFVRAEAARGAGLRCCVAFPIAAGQEFFGVMEFFLDRTTPPDRALLNMMAALGSEIGQFVLSRRAEREVERLNRDLQRRVEELQTLLDVSPIGIAVAADPEALHVTLNPAGAAMLGMKPGMNVLRKGPEGKELAFRTFRVGAELAPEELPMCVAVTRGVAICDLELDVVRADGRESRLSHFASPLFDESGAIRGCLGLFVDVTERTRDQQALRESEARLKIALEAGRMGAWEWNIPTGKVTWSPTLEEIHGVPAGSFGGTFDEYKRDIHPDDFEMVIASIQSALREGTDYNIVYRIIRPDGETAWLESRGRLFYDEAGRPQWMAGVCADVTERRLAEAELARHRDRLSELVEERTIELESSHERLRLSERMAALGTLSAGLGHDMGNMLLPVRVRLDSLESKVRDVEMREDLRTVRTSVEYLQRLATGLRLLALDPENASKGDVTDLGSWREDVSPLLRNVLSRQIALEWDVSDPAPRVALARHHLTQVVFNLVQNAGEALRGREDGVVRIGAAATADGVVRLVVSDNGAGMTPEVQKRCTEPFFTTKPRGLSTGLGLALVHGIVKKSGGSVQIDTAPGRGTRFTLTLPGEAARGPASRGRGASEADRAHAVVSLKDARMRTYIATVLRMLHFDVEMDTGAPAEGVSLWITESGPGVVDEAQRFIDGNPARRVVLFGDGAAGRRRSDRIVELRGAPKPAEIRQALREIATAAEPPEQAGRPHEQEADQSALR